MCAAAVHEAPVVVATSGGGEDGGGSVGDTYECKQHGLLPREAFYSSSIRCKIHLCRACVAQRNKRYFEERQEVFVASECRRREAACSLSPSDAQCVLARFGNKCFVSGASHPLTLVRIDPAQPWGPLNAVPLKRCIARALNHTLSGDHAARCKSFVSEGTEGQGAAGTCTSTPSAHNNARNNKRQRT
jgi:hypothetical protein